jgi:hypothetical protein
MVNIYKSLFTLAVSVGVVSSTTVQKRDVFAFLNTLPTLASAASTFSTDGFGLTGVSLTDLNVSIK